MKRTRDGILIALTILSVVFLGGLFLAPFTWGASWHFSMIAGAAFVPLMLGLLVIHVLTDKA